MECSQASTPKATRRSYLQPKAEGLPPARPGPCCSNVYADADWDEEDEKWRYTNDLGIDVPMGHKRSNWMKYAFSVIFLEARIQLGDAVIVYFENEGGVSCIDTVDYLVEYG